MMPIDFAQAMEFHFVDHEPQLDFERIRSK